MRSWQHIVGDATEQPPTHATPSVRCHQQRIGRHAAPVATFPFRAIAIAIAIAIAEAMIGDSYKRSWR